MLVPIMSLFWCTELASVVTGDISFNLTCPFKSPFLWENHAAWILLTECCIGMIYLDYIHIYGVHFLIMAEYWILTYSCAHPHKRCFSPSDWIVPWGVIDAPLHGSIQWRTSPVTGASWNPILDDGPICPCLNLSYQWSPEDGCCPPCC